MPKLTEIAANPCRRRLLAASAAALVLAACSSVDTHTVNIQTAAAGTKIEARQVVALVYAQAPDAEIDRLLYSGGDLTRAIKRLRDRQPQLKPWLDQGVVGNTASGFVTLRDPARGKELHALLWEENRDRAFLHDRASAAVGHGGDDLNSWLPYASYSFGTEWIAQGQPGWWWMDDQRQWRQGPPKG
ncbi:MAG: DUF1318 domain-containing protein [Rhodocyclaceae bacterium]|nr:DUF1318 domain-containing protein [Rhodocyclaceae bacterium]